MPNSLSFRVHGLSTLISGWRLLVSRDRSGWSALPRPAQAYVAAVIGFGAAAGFMYFPTTIAEPGLFAALVILSCLTSMWKVTLPLGLSSGSTLSVSYAADLMALLLLGPQQAMVVAVTGAWAQCAFKVRRRYPLYRTIFSMAAEALTIQATGFVYSSVGGAVDLVPMASLPKALVAAIATYFVVNTGLVAGAIALSTRQRPWRVWYDNFLWSAPSFMVAGAAGALAALVIDRSNPWLAILMIAPVYLSYRSYQVFLGRIEDERRHAEETQKLHSETIEALLQARRAEEALADEKERLSVTLRSIGDGVITTDLDGTVLLFNHAAEALTGWTLQEAVGRPLRTVFRNFDPETHAPCDNSVAMLTGNDGRPFNRSALLQSRDSSERRIDETAAPLRDADGQTIGMVMVFRDITDALRVQEERAKAGRIASLGLLAGGIAHDFNNILMSIMGNLALARSAASRESAHRAIDDAEKACLRARQLTWHLLTFSRGGVPLKKTLSLPHILTESAIRALRGSNVQCEFDIAADLWPVSADEEQVSQAINNLVVNACQAMPDGGTIEIRAANVLETTARWEHALRVEPGRYIRIAFVDRGIGIPAEHLGRIFDPYFSTKHTGSGLGLATAYSIVKNHGGYITVSSNPGTGTTLTINLPAPLAEIAIRRTSTGTASHAGRILVMDDEAAVRLLTVKMLKALGHGVEVADNGTAAVERYLRALRAGQPFDAILLDLIVPCGLGGREALELISEFDPAVKAIMVSGYAQQPATTEFRDYGFKAVIAKPFTLEELKATLSTVMVTGSTLVH
jgi:PAS domain S-box-containing protein